MNGESDCEELKASLLSSLTPGAIPSLPDCGTPVFVQIIPRNEMSILDWGKVLDCVVAVFSCRNIDISKAKLDPSTCPAFDEVGYSLLTLLRTQGLPPVIGVLQHLETNPTKKQKDIKKLFSRYYESEFPNSLKMCSSAKSYQSLRSITTIVSQYEEPQFKAIRSYFWANSANIVGNSLQVTGYLRGSGILSVNQLVHITGFGDYPIASLVTPGGEILPDCTESMVAENDPGTFAAEQTWPTDHELADAFSRLEVQTDHVNNEMEDSEEEEEEESEELEMSEEEKQTIEFEERTKDDLDFPDEVNTPSDQPARTRFQKYRGLASFRTSQWDPYENLPVTYGKLYEFKEQNHIIKKVAMDQAKSGSQTALGMLVTVNIANFPVTLLDTALPLIVSSLLPHERKLSVVNFKLERWGNTKDSIASKELLTVHYGFRRVACKPIYSEDTTGDKAKYLREFKDNGYIVASIFAPAIYPPCNVLVFKDAMEGPALVAVGSFLSFDPKRLVIKRILLTGYPLKVRKM